MLACFFVILEFRSLLVFILLVFSQRYCSVKVGKLDGDEYQFLQRSYLPTYHFQKSLRRLPIPKLESTCLRFLNAVKAVYGDSCAEVKQTEKIVNEFATNEGPGIF